MSYIHESVIVPYYTNLHFVKTHYCVSDYNQHTRINHCYNWLLKTFLFLQKVFLRRMKTTSLLLIVLSFLSFQAVCQIEPDVYTNRSDTLRIAGEIIVPNYQLEELPQFPGGPDEMVKWIQKELVFPTQDDIQGKCYVKIAVLSSGKIAQPTVARGIPGCPECDKEAIRLVKKMPLWVPGKYKGKAVATEMYIPIVFKR